MTQEFETAKEHLAWLKKTATDKQDLSRIVGYEDCLREWQASRESLKQKLLSDEMVLIADTAFNNNVNEQNKWENFDLEIAIKAALKAVVGVI